jgi:regulator of replication initiation timing
MSSASQIGRLDNDVRELSGHFKQAVSELEQIRIMNHNRLGNRLSGWFRRLTHKKQRKHEASQD